VLDDHPRCEPPEEEHGSSLCSADSDDEDEDEDKDRGRQVV